MAEELLDIKLWLQPMPSISLYCDSEATMSKAQSKVYNGKSRHRVKFTMESLGTLACDMNMSHN